MRKLLENYKLTLFGLVVTFILYVLAAFVFPVSASDQYLVFAIGFMTTFVIATFEHEVPNLFATQIDQKIESYRLFSQIEDGEFRELAREFIADSEYKLRLLSQGEFRAPMGSKYDVGRLYRAQKKICGVYLGTTYQLLGFHSWKRNSEQQEGYYRENLEAIKRGVEIIRVFILSKSKTVNETTGIILDGTIVNEMKKQQKDGIRVWIAWENDIASRAGTKALKDFVIIDADEVDMREHASDGTYEVVIWKNPTIIQRYQHFFSILHGNSLPLDRFLTQFKEGSPSDNS
jgi:hypothetical protein